MKYSLFFKQILSLMLIVMLTLLSGCAQRTPRTGTAEQESSTPKRPYSQRAEEESKTRNERKARRQEARERIRSGEKLPRETRTFTEVVPSGDTPEPAPSIPADSSESEATPPAPSNDSPALDSEATSSSSGLSEPKPAEPERDIPSLTAQELATQQICQAIEQQTDAVTVSNVTEQELLDIMFSIYCIPDYFWLGNNNSYCIYPNQTATVYLTWKYSDVDQKQAQVDQKAEEALRSIPSGAGDYEKALALHDWLCNHITYEFSTDGSDQDIYGGLANGLCVCAGYAKSYVYLLHKAGIEASYLRGYGTPSSNDGGPHAWNDAVLEGELYYFDVTWDDADDDTTPRYYWFAVPSDRFVNSHERRDYSENPLPYTETTATECNYYYHNGYVIHSCDDSTLIEQLRLQSGSTIDLYCSAASTYQELEALVEDANHVYQLLSNSGHATPEYYSYETSPLQRCIRLTLH